MNRFDYSEEDLAHYADTYRDAELSRAEEYIQDMTMKDVWEFFGDLGGRYQSALLRAIRDEDEHEVGAVFMEALREYAKGEAA